MRFVFDEAQLALRDGVRAFLDKECTAEAVRTTWQSPTGRSTDRWRQLAQMGVVGLTVPEEFGGMGLDETWLVLLLEEAGRAALPEPLAGVTGVAAPLLVAGTSFEVQERWLPGIVAGDKIVVVGLPDRRYVEDAHIADLILLAHAGDVHAVEPDAADLVEQPTVDHGRRQFTVRANLTAHTCIAAGGQRALADAADRAALAEAAMLLGAARKMIDLSTEYAQQRQQFGVPIGSFQAVKHHLASALVRTEFARPVVYRAAWSVAKAVPERSEHVRLAATLAAEGAHVAARAALQVHGAIGYTWEHDLHLWMNRALAAT